MLAVSQCAASAITRHIKIDSIGVNPFSAPRLDEQATLDLDAEGELARYAASDEETRANTSLPEPLLALENFGCGENSFQVHSSLPWYGLWAVSNEWKDVSDLASIKEQHSYAALERPYKFLESHRQEIGRSGHPRRHGRNAEAISRAARFPRRPAVCREQRKKDSACSQSGSQATGCGRLSSGMGFQAAELARRDTSEACMPRRNTRAISKSARTKRRGSVRKRL